MDWDDLRFFLSLARTKSLSPAATRLGVNATTISRRIARLSAALGSDLFEQGPSGHVLTPAGERILALAEEMERAALAVGTSASGERARYAGKVRISLSEGLASWVIAPALQKFADLHPDIQIEIAATNGFLNPSKREADIAIMLARPTRGHLLTRRLADYQLGLFAAHEYVARHGMPRAATELQQHKLIGYVPDLIYADELRYLSEIADGLEPDYASSSITIQHRMTAGGLGVCVLPLFIARQDASLVRLCPDIEISRSFWLVLHQDLKKVARVEAVAQWLAEQVKGLSDI
jgi:DNA-binding transcriptional LysR family regulator